MKKPVNKNQKRKKDSDKKVKGHQEDIQKDEEKPFDFGGLPQRDLKKNLGCG